MTTVDRVQRRMAAILAADVVGYSRLIGEDEETTLVTLKSLRSLIDGLIAQQSAERDQEKRRKIAWAIDRKLTDEAVRPMLYYMRGGTCWRPEVKNLSIMVNSIYNGWRMEDVWLER